MKKIRSFFAVISLLAALSGLSLQGEGALVGTVSSWQVSSLSAPVGASTAMRPVHIHPDGPCPGGGSNDC